MTNDAGRRIGWGGARVNWRKSAAHMRISLVEHRKWWWWLMIYLRLTIVCCGGVLHTYVKPNQWSIVCLFHITHTNHARARKDTHIWNSFSLLMNDHKKKHKFSNEKAIPWSNRKLKSIPFLSAHFFDSLLSSLSSLCGQAVRDGLAVCNGCCVPSLSQNDRNNCR